MCGCSPAWFYGTIHAILLFIPAVAVADKSETAAEELADAAELADCEAIELFKMCK